MYKHACASTCKCTHAHEVFQNYTNKIKWSVLHNLVSKNVYINMCLEILPL